MLIGFVTSLTEVFPEPPLCGGSHYSPILWYIVILPHSTCLSFHLGTRLCEYFHSDSLLIGCEHERRDCASLAYSWAPVAHSRTGTQLACNRFVEQMSGNSVAHSVFVQLFNKTCILCEAPSSAHWIQQRQRETIMFLLVQLTF